MTRAFEDLLFVVATQLFTQGVDEGKCQKRYQEHDGEDVEEDEMDPEAAQLVVIDDVEEAEEEA